MTVTLTDLLSSGRPLLIDGATGTELERRGYPLAAAGWSARAIEEAPGLLQEIHRDYVEAGAELITANTFRLHRRNLENWGRGGDQQRLVDGAVRLARRAAGRKALVAASLAPIGDCYSPDEVPSLERLASEHTELAGALAAAGADVILIETMVSGLEAEAASLAAARTGLPFIVSFVVGPAGRLLTGETLAQVLPSILQCGPAAIGINCVSCRHVPDALDMLLEARLCLKKEKWHGHPGRGMGGCGVESGLFEASVTGWKPVPPVSQTEPGPETPIGVYANTGERAEDGSWRVTTASQPAVYAGIAAGWLERGIAFVGGCCGTTPAHVAAMQGIINARLPSQKAGEESTGN